MNGSLPENPATQEQYDRLREIIRAEEPDNHTFYARLAGVLSVGVSAESMERLIFLNTQINKEKESNYCQSIQR